VGGWALFYYYLFKKLFIMANKLETIISRYELVETNIIANQPVGQVNLPSSISNLQNNPERKIFIKDIEVFPVYCQSFSIRNAAVGNLPVAEIPKISLTVYYDGGVFIRYIPLAKLIYTQPPAGIAAPFQHERVAFDMLYPVNIDQCFFQYNSIGAATAYVISVGFTYLAVPVVSSQGL
jgi:hypothetical protein